jgi:formylglycine-generating enzyme required for sulfatase activity
VRKAIAQTAEAVYTSLQPEEQRIARNLFLRLTELGEGVQDSRRRATLTELTPAPELAATTEIVLRHLTDARLITITQDSVEVAHEALIREWPTLREWLAEDREQLRLHRHLTASASEWQRRGHERGELYTGARLAQALEWLTDHAVVLSPLEREFLHESQAQLKRAQRSRQLRWAGAALVAVLGVIVFTLAVTGVLNPYIYRPVDMDDYWVTIPAGSFQMGSDMGEDNAKPMHTVTLDEFEIGRYEVTNRQYEQCVKAGACNPSDEARFNAKANPLEPVVAISWFDAETYCEWLGARLPTEAQWEKAARGGLNGKLYPWGDDKPSCQAGDALRANFRTDGCGFYLTNVGTYAPNGYGLYDMAGNVWEWTSDYYDANYYKSFLRETTNPFGPFDGTTRVIRGGGWTSSANFIQAHVRSDQNPDIRNDYVGFRCAKNK